jgi:glycosyltransferase involved in cell wall biosynthesis
MVPDVERLYRQVDLYVHLSDWEGMPNTVLEAMACGLPVIASRVGGIPELVQDLRTGLLLEPGDEAGLLAASRGLLQDEALRTGMGADARAFVEEHHALKTLPGILAQFYEEILA